MSIAWALLPSWLSLRSAPCLGRYACALRAGLLLLPTAVLSGGGGGYCTQPQCMGQWAVGLLPFTAAPQGTVGIGAPSLHCHTAAALWGAVGSRSPLGHRCTAMGSGHWVSLCTPPHCTRQATL